MHSLSHLGEKKFGNIRNSCCIGIFRKSHFQSSFQAPIIAWIVRSRHSESNECGMTSENALEPELWPFQISKFCFTFEAFQAPIIASIARSRHSESNGCGITSGNALEPELCAFQIWKLGVIHSDKVNWRVIHRDKVNWGVIHRDKVRTKKTSRIFVYIIQTSSTVQ